MASWLKRLYHSLPVVRELNMVREELSRHNRHADIALRTQIEQYLQGILSDPKYADPKRLAAHEAQLYSQNGEDGLISEIFRRIGPGAKTFVEIGVGDGLENNTALLLAQGWNGWWFEADDGNLAAIRRYFPKRLERKSLRLVKSFIDAENVRQLLTDNGVPPEPDFLSLDIDLNTYYVWEAMLSHVRARVFSIEYNGYFPAGVDWKVDYEPQAMWDQSTHYWGASLKAFENLARPHGYRLVGCDLDGVNAFFVRDDLCGDLFPNPATAQNLYEPARGHVYAWRNALPEKHLSAIKQLLIREAGR